MKAEEKEVVLKLLREELENAVRRESEWRAQPRDLAARMVSYHMGKVDSLRFAIRILEV